jgi:transcriptional regulator with XRE-family HTH domain
MITSEQIRAARAMIKWTASDLADRAGVGIATIRRMEIESGVPTCNAKILQVIQNTLCDAGIEFIGTPEDGPGVILRNR